MTFPDAWLGLMSGMNSARQVVLQVPTQANYNQFLFQLTVTLEEATSERGKSCINLLCWRCQNGGSMTFLRAPIWF